MATQASVRENTGCPPVYFLIKARQLHFSGRVVCWISDRITKGLEEILRVPTYLRD